MVTNVKMQVTPDLSRRVQEIVFANGGSWRNGSKRVHFIGKSFLYIDKEAYLTFGINQETYEYAMEEEISAYDFIASQGEQKWLPKFMEEIECSDNKKWSQCYFVTYIPKRSLPFIVADATCGNRTMPFKYCRPLKGTKTLTIDGKDIEISQESFEAFKAQLLNH